MKLSLYRKIVALLALVLIAAGAGAAEQKPSDKKPAEKKGAESKAGDRKPAEAKAEEEKLPGPTEVLKQKDFARMLVKAFRWQQGVPKKPTEADYLAILDGRRTYHFEAEDHYNRKSDNVAVKEYDLYGPFSGKGWVSGVSTTTTAHFKVFLPLEGDYTLKVTAKGDNQNWSVEGKTFKVNSGERFHEEVAGTVHLKAGEQEITVEIPPQGGVDYLVLQAPPLQAIEPLEGWRFEDQLTQVKVAEIGASLLGWERAMPDDKEWKPLTLIASETALFPPTVTRTQIPYLGQFSGKEWLRAGREGAEIQVPLILSDSGVYNVKVRYLGDKLVAYLDGRMIDKPGKPYLEWVDLGLNRLRKGAHTLILKVLPFGGVDAVTLEKRKSSPEDYLKLVGISGNPSDPVTRAQAEKFLTSFVERFKERY